MDNTNELWEHYTLPLPESTAQLDDSYFRMITKESLRRLVDRVTEESYGLGEEHGVLRGLGTNAEGECL